MWKIDQTLLDQPWYSTTYLIHYCAEFMHQRNCDVTVFNRLLDKSSWFKSLCFEYISLHICQTFNTPSADIVAYHDKFGPVEHLAMIEDGQSDPTLTPYNGFVGCLLVKE